MSRKSFRWKRNHCLQSVGLLQTIPAPDQGLRRHHSYRRAGDAGAFAAVLESAGLLRSFETARMYRGPAPVVALDGVFGVTTLELG
jgi:hypothetical protein